MCSNLGKKFENLGKIADFIEIQILKIDSRINRKVNRPIITKRKEKTIKDVLIKNVPYPGDFIDKPLLSDL